MAPLLTICPSTASMVVALTSGRILAISAFDIGVRLFRTVASTLGLLGNLAAAYHGKSFVKFLVAHIQRGDELHDKREVFILTFMPASRRLAQCLVIVAFPKIDLLFKGNILPRLKAVAVKEQQ